MRNCLTCDKSSTLSFNWEYALEGKDRKLAKLAASLAKLRSLKFGELFQCSECGLHWFLEDDGTIMHRVQPDRFDALIAWDREQLIPTDDDLASFSALGATRLGKEQIAVPCSVETTSGARHSR